MATVLCWILIVIIAIAGVVTLAFYCLRYLHRRRHPEQYRVSAVDTSVGVFRGLLAILAEWGALGLLIVSYPLRLIHDLAPVRRRDPDSTPVILIHGYGANSACFLWLQWRLKRLGIRDVYAVSYTPPTINMRTLARQVARHVERILEATGAQQVHVVGHSMGGPLIRLALQHENLAGKIGRVITLGSPHAGSWLSNATALPGAASQMRYQGAFLAAINTATPDVDEPRYFSIWSAFDNFVLPPTSSLLEAPAKNIHVPALGHCSLLFSCRVRGLIVKALDGQLDSPSA